MVRPAISDPTAGERARNIREHPARAQQILDPTDRRCGESQPDDRARGAKARLVSDPTDPQCGAPAA